MLRDITIQNYRCFEDFHMDGLERVNLFVGNNNSGKTSLLEAIYLLVSEDRKLSLFNILSARNEFIKVLEQSVTLYDHIFPVDHILYGHKIHYDEVEFVNGHKIKDFKKILISSVADISIEVELEVSPWSIEIKYLLKGDNSQGRESIQLDEDSRIKRQTNYLFKKNTYPHILLTRTKYDFNQLASMWDNIALTFKEELVVSALKIIQPDVEKIGFSISYPHNMIRLKLKDIDIPVPINSMGEGMYTALTIAMSLVTAENGVLLVDEIETGLHYEAQTNMWRLILETAKELNVQVFATTHSWDCIAAYQEALSQDEDSSIGKLFRLDSKYGKLRAVEYDAEDLEVVTREGIEVR